MRHAGRMVSTPGPVLRLGALGLAFAPAILLLGWLLSSGGVVATVALYAGGLALALRGMRAGYPHARMGACNGVTLGRLGLVAGLAAAILPTGGMDVSWAIFAVAVVALCLDGVDGYLARRSGLVSAFGARFDMEVDAALAAVLAAILLGQGRAGPELLVLGGARYAFVAIAALRPWLAQPLPESRRRKLVCVIQIATLAALVPPLLPDVAARTLALAAAGLLTWSFAVDIRRLARRR